MGGGDWEEGWEIDEEWEKMENNLRRALESTKGEEEIGKNEDGLVG